MSLDPAPAAVGQDRISMPSDRPQNGALYDTKRQQAASGPPSFEPGV